MQKFFDDLGVNASSDIVTILISSKMNAQAMGVYTLEEFKKGFTAMACGSTEDLKKKLPQLYQELKN